MCGLTTLPYPSDEGCKTDPTGVELMAEKGESFSYDYYQLQRAGAHAGNGRYR